MMKKKIPLTISAFLLGSMAAHAEHGTAQTRDLWYLPAAGKFQSSTTLGYNSTTLDLDYSGGPNLTDNTLELSEEFNYSILDELQVGIDVGYSTGKRESLTGATTKSSKTASGITDPSLVVLYRILKQDEQPVFLDVSLAISPSLGKVKIDNRYRGSNDVSLSAKVGQSFGAFEYAAGPVFTWHSDTKTSGGTDTKSHYDYGVFVAAQYDFTEMVALNAALVAAFPGTVKAKAGGTTVSKTDYSLGLVVGPSFQLTDSMNTGLNLGYTRASGDYLGADATSSGFAAAANFDIVF